MGIGQSVTIVYTAIQNQDLAPGSSSAMRRYHHRFLEINIRTMVESHAGSPCPVFYSSERADKQEHLKCPIKRCVIEIRASSAAYMQSRLIQQMYCQ